METKRLTPEEQNELNLCYELYAQFYDHATDATPPLGQPEWEETYGTDVLNEARARGDIA